MLEFLPLVMAVVVKAAIVVGVVVQLLTKSEQLCDFDGDGDDDDSEEKNDLLDVVVVMVVVAV